MQQVIHDEIGAIHLLTSILALLFGSIVLCTNKGTPKHRFFGYAYVLNMFIVLISALFIYRLFDGIGVFHFIAIIGFIYLLAGVLPVFFRLKNWIELHVYFMYWSVIGLYAAFIAEVAVRIPNAPFWWMVGIGTAAVSVMGGYYYGQKKDLWKRVGEKIV